MYNKYEYKIICSTIMLKRTKCRLYYNTQVSAFMEIKKRKKEKTHR